MIKLASLTMRGFRSFVNETTIKFPSSGLLLLQGRNGSGKSTIGLAIAYALGYCPFPASALKSWQGVEMQVTLELITTDGVVVIQRGAKNSVVVQPWEAQAETTKGSIAAVDTKIQEIIGLESGVLGELCYRQQQTRGTFVSKTDKEKKEFLCQLLKLDLFERAVEDTKDRIKSYEISYNLHSSAASLAQERVRSFRPRPYRDPQLSPKIVELDRELEALAKDSFKHESDIWDLGQKADKLKTTLGRQKDSINIEVDEYRAKLVPTPYDTTRLNELDGLVKKAQRKLDALRDADSKRMVKHFSDREELVRLRNLTLATIAGIDDELNSKRPKLVKDLETLKSSQCPTCKQEWLKAKDHILQAELMIATIDKRAEDLPHLLGRVYELGKELQRAEEGFVPDPEIGKYVEIHREATRQWSEEEGFRKASDASQSAGQRVLVEEYRRQLEGGLSALKIELDDVVTALQSVHKQHAQTLKDTLTKKSALETLWQSVRAEDNMTDNWKREFDRLEEEVREKAKSADATKALCDQERDFLALIGREGFLGAIFDEVLREISDETNAVLSVLPNTSDVVLEFKSENETQGGKISREIKPVVTIRGNTAPLKAGCSGGMYLSVEQAVDIAVNRVVSRRTGVVPGWIVMDECFGDQDLPTKEEAMSVLRELGRDRLVIVVDHATEFKEAFTQFINLEFRNGESFTV